MWREIHLLYIEEGIFPPLYTEGGSLSTSGRNTVVGL